MSMAVRAELSKRRQLRASDYNPQPQYLSAGHAALSKLMNLMPTCSFCGETLRYLGTSGSYTCDNANCPDPINQQAQQILARRKLEEKLPD